jgi:hypothetical protein
VNGQQQAIALVGDGGYNNNQHNPVFRGMASRTAAGPNNGK